MNKTTIILLLFGGFLAGVRSAVYLAYQNQIPGHPNQCYDKSRTVFYNKGDIMMNELSDKICGEKVCLGKSQVSSEKVLTEFKTCGIVEGVIKRQIKTCNITETLGPYPDCCVPHENETPEYCGPVLPEPEVEKISANKIRR